MAKTPLPDVAPIAAMFAVMIEAPTVAGVENVYAGGESVMTPGAAPVSVGVTVRSVPAATAPLNVTVKPDCCPASIDDVPLTTVSVFCAFTVMLALAGVE